MSCIPCMCVAFDQGSGQSLAIGRLGKVDVVTVSHSGYVCEDEERTMRAYDNLKMELFTNATVLSVAMSACGKHLLTGVEHGDVSSWSRREDGSWGLVQTARLHAGAASGVALNYDGTVGCSGSPDKTVIVWDICEGEMTARFGQSVGDHNGEVWAVGLSSTGDILASGSQDGRARVFLISGSKPVLLCEVGEQASGAVQSVSLDSSGRLLATGGDDGIVRLWNVALKDPEEEIVEPSLLHSLPPSRPGKEILSVSMDGAGSCVAVGEQDGNVQVWDVAPRGGKARRRVLLKGHGKTVWGVAMQKDGKRVASAGQDGTVRVWDVEGPYAELEGEPDTCLCGHH